MRKPLEFYRMAVREGRRAFLWYARRNMRVALEFRDALKKAYDEIESHPHSWPTYLYGTRVIRPRKYPYLVVYREMPAYIVVIAIAHGHRRPGYWKNRRR